MLAMPDKNGRAEVECACDEVMREMMKQAAGRVSTCSDKLKLRLVPALRRQL